MSNPIPDDTAYIPPTRGPVEPEEAGKVEERRIPPQRVEDVIQPAGEDRTVERYNATADQPALPAPIPVRLVPASSSPTTQSQAINPDYVAAFNSEFAALIDNSGLSTSQRGLAEFLHYNPDAEIEDGQVRTLVASAEKRALEQTRNRGAVPQDWTPPRGDPRGFNTVYVSALDSILEQLKRDQGISEEEALQLEFAFYHEELASPALLKRIKELKIKQKLTEALTGAGFTVPDSWRTNTAYIDYRATIDFDNEFERRLITYAQQNQLTDDQVRKMKLKHYHPEINVSLSKELLEAQIRIENEATSAVRRTYGAGDTLPSRWPNPDTEVFDGTIRANYQFLNEEGLRRLITQNRLTTERAALLRKALANPDEASIPAEVRAQAAQILANSKDEIMKKYGITNTEILTGPALWREDSGFRLDSLRTLMDSKDILDKYIQELPETPEKVLLVNYLKAISEAIVEMQEALYAQESRDVSVSQLMAKAMQESQQYKIESYIKAVEEQKRKQKEMEEQQKKGGIIGDIMQVLTPILITLSVVSAVAMGPAAACAMIAITALTTAEQMTGNHKIIGFSLGLLGTAAGEFAKLCGADEDAVKFIQGIVNVATAIAIIACTGVSPASIMVATQTFTTTNAVQDICLGCGVEAKKAALASMICGAVVMVAGMVASIAVTQANRAENIKQLSEKVQELNRDIPAMSKQLASLSKTSAEFYTSSAKYAYAVFERALAKSALSILEGRAMLLQGAVSGLKIGTGGLTITNAIIEGTKLNLQAELAQIQAQSEEQRILYADIIKAMQQAINRLIELIEDAGKVVGHYGKLSPQVIENSLVTFDAMIPG